MTESTGPSPKPTELGRSSDQPESPTTTEPGKSSRSDGPTVTQIRMLAALQLKQVYAGTVPARVKASRRAANKRARVARRATR